ncbi:uncharacterized protein G2W53_033130 [Senna tora]|uniref:Uncharacterized protein n=1 Tax=Senna tora TaxID=362788 RepID=A0A834SXW1_9FABA|nr:uncharacterized protein G2W53_033130 [Senna tora]
MEESPEGKEKKEEVIPHLDSENGESKIKSVKRALWVPDPAVNQSYKDKLWKVEVRDEAFGPWMTVQLNRRRRPRPPAKNQQPASAPKYPNSGLRFEVFNLEESGDMDIDKVVENKDQEASDVATGVVRKLGAYLSYFGRNKKPIHSRRQDPIKSNESNPKAPTKHPMAIPKGRADKDAQMEEQLRAMRMFEKQNREVASSLVDLGATQVYSNFL